MTRSERLDNTFNWDVGTLRKMAIEGDGRSFHKDDLKHVVHARRSRFVFRIFSTLT